MPSAVTTDDVPIGKYRAIERVVKKKEERSLGDFDSVDAAIERVQEIFRAQEKGWFSYHIYNDRGIRMYLATATKRKWFFFTKTNFSSEFGSIQTPL
jgi:hypothetical protein